MIRRGLLIALAALSGAAGAYAQNAQAPESVLPNRPDSDTQSLALDPPFLSSAAGISVRPPAGGKMIRRAGSADEVVRFVNDEKKWQMVVSRFLLAEPMPLMTKADPVDPSATPKIGFVDTIVSQMVGAEAIRSEPVPISGFDGALLATRARDASGEKLIQHAIVRRSDKIYYLITYTIPVGGGKIEEDPQAVRGMQTFEKIHESIELLDQEAIANDQTERLLRTRGLMVNWSQAKLDSVLVGEQWLRLVKEGKDIGYTYIVEERANDLPRAGKSSVTPEKPLGVRIGVRSRTIPSADFVVDAESWFWVSYNRDQEAFSNIIMSREKGQEANYAMEHGSAIRRNQLVKLDEPEKETGNLVTSVKDDRYELQIWSTAKRQSLPPITRQVPPFYLPQALGQLLPRLLPLNTPNTFLWASYVSETRNVMTRYVDVLPVTTVTLDGKTFSAVPVQERLGLEGSITTHYITPSGAYRGSVNEESQISIIPSDKESILAIWKDANLNRPGDVDEKK